MTTVIISGGAQPVTPGKIGQGDVLIIEGGGTTLSAVIDRGSEDVFGTDLNGTLSGHAFAGISAGGSALNTLVTDSATQTLFSGGYSNDVTLAEGGTQILYYSGVAESSTVDSAGFMVVSGGGTAVDLTLHSGGSASFTGFEYQSRSVFGTAENITVNSGGLAVVSSFGALSGGTVDAGGFVLALSGSVVSAISVASGGFLVATPGATVTATGPVISTGIVLSAHGTMSDTGELASGLDLSSGMLGLVLSGGRVESSHLRNGASLQVYSGGSTSAVSVSDAYLVVNSGALTSATRIDDGGVQYVFSGGTAESTTVDQGFSFVDFGGTAWNTDIRAGGLESTDGTTVSTRLESGGGQYVFSSGYTIDTEIESGAFSFVLGSASGTVIDTGGYMVISDGGSANGIILSGGLVVAQGSASLDNTSIGSGGVLFLMSGAIESGVTVGSGGTFIALSGASVLSLSSAPGADVVSSAVVVFSGGTAATVTSGTFSNETLTSGTTTFVLSGATESAVTISTGAESDVFSGGTAQDVTIGAGGILDLEAGAVASGAITFSGISATLKVNTSSLPNAVLSGFSVKDGIDLVGVSATGLSVSLTSNNVLDVISGGGATSGGSLVASFQLDSGTDYSTSNFVIKTFDDGSAEVTISSNSSPVTSANSDQTVDIPLYVMQDTAGGYKVGIELSLDGGATYRLYEFDTGAPGFYSSYVPGQWGSFTPAAAAPSNISYASGNNYFAEPVTTNVTFRTSEGPLTASNVDVGLIATGTTTENPTPQSWNESLTSLVSNAPIEGSFYGDFGVGLNGNNEIRAILAQLSDGLSDGFIVTLGAAPNIETGQIGTLQIGLTQADIASFGTVVAMQGQNNLDPFSVSGLPTYGKALGSGTVTLSNQSIGSSSALPSTFLFDTGAPSEHIYTGFDLLSSSIDPFLSGDKLTSGTTSILSAGQVPGSTTGWVESAVATNETVAQTIKVGALTSGAGYVNTGIQAFFGESIMFDVADGLLGFKAIACFAAGTRIMTPEGEVPVETLQPGSLVVTDNGAAHPVQWVGQRTVDCWRHPKPETVLPVRVSRNAFGSGLPRRDLFLSPDHALYLESVLIPVKHLINGDNVVQIDQPRPTYYHIELSSHNVVLAEGLPAETYLETGQRLSFANGGAAVQAHPVFAPAEAEAQLLWAAMGYAPLVVSGPKIERVRQRLMRQGGLESRAG